MKNNNTSWRPTLTLAKLFEEQQQFYEALAIYELIYQTNKSPAIQQHIEDMHSRILNNYNNRYDSRIDQLFTPEELAYFKILDHQGFENMCQVRKKLQEGSLASEVYIEEDEDNFNFDEIDNANILSQILEEIEQQAQLNLMEPENEISEYTIQDLLMALLSKFNKEQKLTEVSLSDLVDIILEMQAGKFNS
ncbi:MAG: hypothetical protein PHY63_03805 [Candidatus Cloacimonetes bacterium]|jgi:hypothetical protein|nr:hypothetical protein [Candidatus Cloacimonadota bacterium]